MTKNISNIVFTKTFDVSDEFEPKPADKFIPDWYKNLDSYFTGSKKPDGKGGTTSTIKRCMPVFDAITGGYILVTHTDIFVSQKKTINEQTNEEATIPMYEWPSSNALGFHPIFQAPNYPDRNNLHDFAMYPKFINPWAIQTPPGYSCLFVQPFHRESIFTILPGIVDTDTYSAPVNFPFALKDWSFEGLIPAGTPMAQVIPFKRDSWEMKFGTIDEFKKQQSITNLLRTKFFDSYKTQFRSKKEYK